MAPDDISASMGETFGTTPQRAEEIWDEFFPQLVQFVRRKLHDIPRRAFDEEDVALSALHSFFRGQAAGKFEALDSRGDLWRLLVTITARKSSEQRRKFLSQKRGRGAVRGESAFVTGKPGEKLAIGLAGIVDPNQLPESVTEIVHSCEELLSQLPNDLLRETAVLRLKGYSNGEIAAEMNCSLARTKQRVARIKQVWAESLRAG